MDNTETLIAFAHSLGVADAKLMDVSRVVVEDRFRLSCEEPRCPSFDTSANCPPHSMLPAEFRVLIRNYTRVLAFKFDVPVTALEGEDRREASLLLHQTTADIEHRAKELGFERARGYSSGGCKQTFCHDHPTCQALQPDGRCRNPRKARPSLSGMGVNWHNLTETLGWEMLKNESGKAGQNLDTFMMAGLVFLE